MIRFRLSELIAEKQFREGRRVTLLEIADATGINRMTLSRMLNVRGYNTVTHNLDRLCAYFACTMSDLAVFVPDSSVPESSKDRPKSRRKPP